MSYQFMTYYDDTYIKIFQKLQYEKNGLPEGRPPKVAPEGDL